MQRRLFLVCAAQVVAHWDPFGIGHAARSACDRLVSDLTHELVPAVKQAINDELDVLFDDKLPTMIEEANKAMADLVDHAKDQAEILMTDTVGNITAMVHNMIDEAGQMMHKTVEEIKADLDNFVDVHLTGLVDHIGDGLNNLLTRVEMDVKQAACIEEGILKQLELFIDEKTDTLDCGCVLQVKEAWAQPCDCSCSDKLPTKATCHCSPSSWIATEDQLAYEYIECQQRKAIESGLLPVDKIVQLLGGLRSLSEQLRCYHLKDGPSTGILGEYTGHVLNISKEIYIWNNPFEPVTV